MEERSFEKKRPDECSPQEITEFMNMVLEGDQVQEEGLRELVMSADWLGFARIDAGLASVAAVKMPRTKYRDNVFKCANSDHVASTFVIEFGWAFTRYEHKGKGLGSALADLLLDGISGPIFATTGINNGAMRHILKKHGFSESGSPYQGRREKKVLHVRMRSC